MPMPKSTRTQEEWREYHRLRMARWREANPERSKENTRQSVARWREINPEANREMKIKSYQRRPVTRMLKSAEQRATKARLPFALTPEDITIPTHCPVFGFELDTGGDHRNNSPSLDRIKPELGYIKGNVHVISMRANRIKNDATPEELRLLADYVARLASMTDRLTAVREYIAREMVRPYEKGVTDCGGTIDRWVIQASGVSPVTAFGKQLRNAADAAEWLEVPQMFAVLINRAARAGGFKKTSNPVPGDIGLIANEKGIIAPAIHAGDYWFTRHETGAFTVPIDKFWKAWSV